MYPMRFPPFLFSILAALIVFGGLDLLFKFMLIAALFVVFSKFFGFGRWGWDHPGHPRHHRGRFHGGGCGHPGHPRRPHPRGPWAWDWDEEEVEVTDTDSRKKKNAPRDDDTVDAEAWV